MQIYFGTKWCFDVDINESGNPGQQILKYKGGGSQDSSLDLCDQVVKVGEGWMKQKLWSHKAGLPNESYILQDNKKLK
jgi:hypothetical protein